MVHLQPSVWFAEVLPQTHLVAQALVSRIAFRLLDFGNDGFAPAHRFQRGALSEAIKPLVKWRISSSPSYLGKISIDCAPVRTPVGPSGFPTSSTVRWIS